MSPSNPMIRIQVFAIIALLSTSSVYAASGHDGTAPSFGPTSYAVRDPLVATNGVTFLTLWTTEAGVPGKFIYGSIADAGGHKTTQASFRLLPVSAELVDLTAFGSDYLVMWRNASGLHTSVVSGNGAVLREGPTIAPPTTQFVHVHTNGRTVLFTYHTNGPLSWPTETRAQLTSMEGVAIGSPVLLGDQALQTATPLGDDYVTLTTEANGTYFLRLDKNGHVVVSKRLIAATSSLQNVAAATDGSGILVATLGMFIALSGDGIVLNTRSVEPEAGSESSLIWTGDSYLHIRRKGFSALAQRLDRLGRPLGDPLSFDAGVSSAATHEGVVYAAGRTEDRGNVGFAVTSGNAALNGAGDILSVTPSVQTAPVLASDGVNFLTGWTEEIARSHSFAMKSVSREALPMNAQQTDLGTVEPAASQNRQASDAHLAHYSVACNGLICLTIWEDSNSILGKWVIAGAASASSFVIGSGHISDQAVVWNGRGFYVVWNGGELYSATVLTTGAITERVQLTGGSDFLSSPPIVAWDGRRYLLMSTFDSTTCDCWNSSSAISFYVIATDGRLIGQGGFQANFMDAHLAASGHDFLVVYDHRPFTAVVSEAATRRIIVTDTAVQIEPAVPLFQWFSPTSSSVVWNGQDYVVAWRYGSDFNGWLTSARVTASAFPDRRATASGVPDRQVKPAIASNAAGESVIVVSESLTPGESARLRAYAERDLDSLPPLPSAPQGVYTTGSASSLTVHWQSDGLDVAGFVVERPDNGYVLASVEGSQRSVVVTGAPSVQVRAFNAGGLSEAGFANPRRRASR
ncbi:MAG: hypothetical protein QOC81_3663 [Thermoanaerobaculia bacterium]|nr:hypothetical protein [Thermoanaerobaculia bacterium]